MQHGDLPESSALLSVIHGGGRGGRGNPSPERTVFKQGALASHHRTPSTAAAPVIITLGVA